MSGGYGESSGGGEQGAVLVQQMTETTASSRREWLPVKDRWAWERGTLQDQMFRLKDEKLSSLEVTAGFYVASHRRT